MGKVSRCLHSRREHFSRPRRKNEMSKGNLNSVFFFPFPRLIPTKPELMRPTNVQQRCWGVVKCAHLCSLPNAVGQDSTFMLFSSYYLVGLHTYTHQSTPIVNVVLCHSSASQQYYVFCSFWVSFFPKVVYSSHLVALTPYIRCLGFHFSFSLLSGVC